MLTLILTLLNILSILIFPWPLAVLVFIILGAIGLASISNE